MFEGSNIAIAPDRQRIISKAVIDRFVDTTLSAKSSMFITDVARGTAVDCLIKNSYRGQIFLMAEVIEMAFSHVNLRNVRVVKEIQKRQEVRVDVRIPITIHRLIVSGAYVSLNKPILMRVRNVSACGLLLNSDLEIPINVGFSFDLKLNSDIPPLTAVANPTRREKLNNKGGYNYGCNLTLMDSMCTSMIRKYTYKRQIDERNRYLRKDCSIWG